MESIKKYIPAVAIVLVAFLAVQTINGLKAYNYIGTGSAQNTISVTGDGEVFATPDIATFTWSVTETGANVKDAQTKATTKVNAALESLKQNGIEEKDIKTVNFNANPKYEFTQSVCTSFSCPPSKQTLVGYEVTQSVSVKVRAVDNAGKVIDGVTSAGVSEVSSLSFTVDDQDALIAQARGEAIKKAKAKAKVLAKDLDVDLVRIVSFSDGNGYPTPIMYKMDAMTLQAGREASVAPSLPTGENKITSNVTITYEVR
jgi:uncharacterized protein YggE